MPRSQRHRLDSTLAALERRHGAGVLRKAAELDRRLPPSIPTGFPQLDDLTGCGGVPCGVMSLFSGRSTSGKLTVAFKVLAHAQQTPTRPAVALMDLNRTCDPDYLQRAGVDLSRLHIVRPAAGPQVVDVLVGLARSRKVRALVVNGLPNLLADLPSLRPLRHALAAARCALLWIDEPSPAWLRWLNLDRSALLRPYLALHVELRWEQWLGRPEIGELRGYRAQAQLPESRWAASGRAAPVEIAFNGTIKVRATW